MLTEIATYMERALLCFHQQTLMLKLDHLLTTILHVTNYMRPRLIITLMWVRHTLCTCIFLVIQENFILFRVGWVGEKGGVSPLLVLSFCFTLCWRKVKSFPCLHGGMSMNWR